ncbi:tripartite tricarboxylate transporter substrate binding protein [Comamonas antarctica]
MADWPDKPIRLVVPYPAGGAADNTARILAQELGERLKQQIIVDNKPGASGTIGAAFVAKAPADGYTLLLDATSYTVNPSLYNKLSYNPEKELVPVSQIMQVPLLMVVPANSRFTSVADVVKAAAAQPGKLSYASAGNGGAQHLAAELFAQGQKLQMTHVPYKGGAPALTDLIGGQLDLMFSATTASGTFVKGGKLKALAISSGKRQGAWPQVPTVAESGATGFEVYEWNGLFAPAGTPRAVLARLESETQAVVASPTVAKRFDEMGVQGVGSSAKDFTAFVKAETAKWAEVIKTSKIRTD